MLKQLATLLCLPTLALAANAQDVHFVGKVENVSGTNNQFFVDCTSTALTSALVDLNAWVGQTVEIQGNWNGSASEPGVSVNAVSSATESFELGGKFELGENAVVGFTGNPGDTAIGFLSLGSGFSTTAAGSVVFLDPGQVVLSLSGVIGGLGDAEFEFTIPNVPSIAGIEVFGQGAIVSATTTALTNPDCKTIQ